MAQRKATKTETMYPTITMTQGQHAAFAYLLANTNQGQIELFQTIFDAGLTKVFQVASQVHVEYLEEVTAGGPEGDDADNRP